MSKSACSACLIQQCECCSMSDVCMDCRGLPNFIMVYGICLPHKGTSPLHSLHAPPNRHSTSYTFSMHSEHLNTVVCTIKVPFMSAPALVYRSMEDRLAFESIMPSRIWHSALHTNYIAQSQHRGKKRHQACTLKHLRHSCRHEAGKSNY